jgi:hypothetical protein
VTPNFVNPPSRQTAIIILEAIFTPLMLLAVAARVWVRTCIVRLWGAEDSKWIRPYSLFAYGLLRRRRLATCILAAVSRLCRKQFLTNLSNGSVRLYCAYDNIYPKSVFNFPLLQSWPTLTVVW